jgi:hypothetical protein
MLTPSSFVARQRLEIWFCCSVVAAPLFAAGACANAGIVNIAVAAKALKASLFMAVSFFQIPALTGPADTTAQPLVGSLMIETYCRAGVARDAMQKKFARIFAAQKAACNVLLTARDRQWNAQPSPML